MDSKINNLKKEIITKTGMIMQVRYVYEINYGDGSPVDKRDEMFMCIISGGKITDVIQMEENKFDGSLTRVYKESLIDEFKELI